MAGVAVGDSVLTSSGFYGVIIDMTDDTVIVESGKQQELPYSYAQGCNCSG